MERIQVFLLEKGNLNELEKGINNFLLAFEIDSKNIVDIKYSSFRDDEIDSYSAMIIYKDIRRD